MVSYYMVSCLIHPPVAFIVFLAVADEDVVFVACDYTCHNLLVI
jgi:hypothetical protein